MNTYQFLANLILIVHCAYIFFVVAGLVVIVAGALLGWSWVRNFWFRLVHFLMMAFVAFEAIIGMICPLTEWEQALRIKAGEENFEGDFIAEWLTRLFFFEFEPWVFTTVYIGFALLILAIMWLVPPRRPGFWKSRTWSDPRQSAAPPKPAGGMNH